jgi:hypothetical protein
LGWPWSEASGCGRGFHRVANAQRLAGVDALNGWIGLLLFLVFSPAYWASSKAG